MNIQTTVHTYTYLLYYNPPLLKAPINPGLRQIAVLKIELYEMSDMEDMVNRLPDPTTTNKNTPRSTGPTGKSSSFFYRMVVQVWVIWHDLSLPLRISEHLLSY